RGSRTMDSPLVLTTVLNPKEVDDMAHGLDIAGFYPLEFYEAACSFKNPWAVHIDQIKHMLGTPKQYEGFKFTHDTTNSNEGNLISAYKVLPSMKEKLEGQMKLATKIRAVDDTFVADLVIQKHFLKDILGNLRKFSQQQFRCVNCNEKFRRPPLAGKCPACEGKIIFTISEGSIIKYLEPSLELASVFNVNPYIKQTLDLAKLRIESVFGKEKEKQVGLGSWI
ncbi:MAG: DNA polymerase II large subunit, partial [Candidatus Woesearchaeota archaeon]